MSKLDVIKQKLEHGSSIANGTTKGLSEKGKNVVDFLTKKLIKKEYVTADALEEKGSNAITKLEEALMILQRDPNELDEKEISVWEKHTKEGRLSIEDVKIEIIEKIFAEQIKKAKASLTKSILLGLHQKINQEAEQENGEATEF